jgi:hypothetical protein
MIPRKAVLALLAAGAALSLAGCGRQAELARPQPMWGKPRPVGAQKLTRQQAAARARADAAPHADPVAPQSVEEVRDQPLAGQKPRQPSGQTTSSGPE